MYNEFHRFAYGVALVVSMWSAWPFWPTNLQIFQKVMVNLKPMTERAVKVFRPLPYHEGTFARKFKWINKTSVIHLHSYSLKLHKKDKQHYLFKTLIVHQREQSFNFAWNVLLKFSAILCHLLLSQNFDISVIWIMRGFHAKYIVRVRSTCVE